MSEQPRLRDVEYPPGYDSNDDVLTSFYVPALSRATSYDRSVGYFRSSSLSVAARGVSRFVHNGGTMRLLVGAELTVDDAQALRGAAEIPADLAARLSAELVTDDEVARRRLAVLAWLVRHGRLEVKVAVALDGDGNPLVGDDDPFFHEKIGVLRDGDSDGVAFQGSINETARAWTRNFESFSVFPSWTTPDHYRHWVDRFEQRWAGDVRGYSVYPLPEAVAAQLLTYAPNEPPPERDPEEVGFGDDRSLIARYLMVAPRLPTAQQLAEATIPVEPFPHQRQVVERLAGTYPRSWLVADEVGLGKTISAGLALRRLVLSGQVERALILAPANVARQWQDELFEKFGLWVPRLDSGKIHGVHADDVRPVEPGSNPYAREPLLIASSHLARRRDQRGLVLDAAPFDLLVVDEAHHARRRSFADPAEYRPSLLLSLLDDLRTEGKLDATWLLTATPMQVDPIELGDLLRQIGLAGALSSWANFQRFYAQLAQEEGEHTDWRWLATMLQETPLPEPGPADEALLEAFRAKVGVVDADRIARFVDAPGDRDEAARQLGVAGRAELRAWLRQRSPVGQLVTRHSRETLKRYRDEGLLTEPVADRDVEDVDIPFTDVEKDLYARLDGLIDRLTAAHGSRRNAGFVLTIYRRRLTSSWAAIHRTLTKRLAREGSLADQLDLDLDLAFELGDEAAVVDEDQAVPLTADDLHEIRGYLDALKRVPDTKFGYLTQHIDRARAEGRALIVFTQFTDTLNDLRDRLVGAYRDELATYTGQGGALFDVQTGQWTGVSKQELVDRVRDGGVTVVLANDAASEGLNLQTASYLVNYDLPWNPMKLEQRIGRIDRIGQQWPIVTVRNFTIPGTVEVDVQRALRARIGMFHDVVGKLQPILGAAEQAVRDAYRVGRDQRADAVKDQVQELLRQVDELEQTGIDLLDEDPLPMPDHPRPPVEWAELRTALDDLGVQLAGPGRPVTFERVGSRDDADWLALGSYGHPALQSSLDKIASTYDEDRGTVVFREDGMVVEALRADRSPPEPVRSISDLTDLGAPLARGAAIEAADMRVRVLARERRAAYTTAAALRRSDSDQAIRRRFRELIAEVLAARIADRATTDGDEPDPAMAWFDLRDDPSTLRYAPAFAHRLGMSISELLPSPAALAAARNQDRAGRRRRCSGLEVELAAMMNHWKGTRESGRDPTT